MVIIIKNKLLLIIGSVCSALDPIPQSPWNSTATLTRIGDSFGPCLGIKLGVEHEAAPSCPYIDVLVYDYFYVGPDYQSGPEFFIIPPHYLSDLYLSVIFSHDVTVQSVS